MIIIIIITIIIIIATSAKPTLTSIATLLILFILR